MFKVIEANGKVSFAQKMTEFFSANVNAKIEYVTKRGPEGGKGMIALVTTPNGISEVSRDSAELDATLLKENDDLKKQLDIKNKELATLQSHYSDMQDKFAEAMADGELLTECKQDLEIEKTNNVSLNSELKDVKQELTVCKGKNTKLENKIKKLIEE